MSANQVQPRRHVKALVASTLSLLAIFNSVASAAPAVAGVSGSVDHNASVTISGSGFGTKATAAPMVWDNASGTNMSNKWSGRWPNNNATYNTEYRSPMRGIALPHGNVTKYIAGAHGDNTGYASGWNVTFYKTFNITQFPTTIYASWYYRADSNWNFCSQGVGDNNFKDFAYSIGGTPYEMPNNWYINHQALSSLNATPQWTLNDDSPLSLRNPDNNGHNIWWGQGPNPMKGWIKAEVEAKLTPNTDGYVKLWEDGKLLVNYSGPTDKYAGSTSPPTQRTVGFGGYAVCYGLPNNWRYFVDAYLDNTPARVVLANNADLSKATIIEPQLPTAWSGSSITATVNLGKFTSGQTAYVHVVDSGAVHSATGFPITVGGTSTAKVPSPPTGAAAN
jgi:hypothetical protein